MRTQPWQPEQECPGQSQDYGKNQERHIDRGYRRQADHTRHHADSDRADADYQSRQCRGCRLPRLTAVSVLRRTLARRICR
ncbi:hypothetical protein Aau02nite_72700 [Amorphoplanes auranticolor]|uniref:Uncharacterized protein n=1 Tax=Actinoplanes auranticolor TaxID=47988 RepID=A0A919SSL1_9ACTN|nr:hypothetical protein Aau02nite_72700 [Actinoplanes auranticolor]